jgi:CHAD domain-containing protein
LTGRAKSAPRAAPPETEPASPPVPARLRPDDRVLAASRRVVAVQTAAFVAHRAGAAEGRDPEQLHDLRVAARRLRFALRLFAPFLDRGSVGGLRSQLGALMLAMEEVRDLDVLLAALPADLRAVEAVAPATEHVLRLFRDAREPAQQRLAQALRSPAFDELLRGLERLAAPQRSLGAARPEDEQVRIAAAGILRRAGRRALKAGAAPLLERTPEQLHELRIVTRRFRYTCEFFSGVLDAGLRSARSAAVAVQDILGALQDAATALERLRGAVSVAVAEAPPDVDVVMVLGALAQLRRRRAAKLQRGLPAAWSAFRRTAGRLVRRLG